MKISDFDHPIVFGLTMTLVVVGFIAVLSWIFLSIGWTGPLQVLKGGISSGGSTQNGPAPQ